MKSLSMENSPIGIREIQLTEEELHSKLLKSHGTPKWRIWLFPFPKFAFLSIFFGIFPILLGVLFLIVGLVAFTTIRYLIAIFFVFLSFAAFGVGGFLIAFGFELWKESRPFWRFHD